jgi:hypothetical protein
MQCDDYSNSPQLSILECELVPRKKKKRENERMMKTKPEVAGAV